MGESITSAIGIGLEARSDAHHWAWEIQTLSHQVRLIDPQCVKPYVQGDKTDRPDATAICEAVSRPHMRFVPINSLEQQDIQSLHRIREMVVKSYTTVANQIRGLLQE